jgi:hypothetical protein
MASSYKSLSVSGVRALFDGDYLSVWVYADEDTDYRAGESRSGFHVVQLSTELPSVG